MGTQSFLLGNDTANEQTKQGALLQQSTIPCSLFSLTSPLLSPIVGPLSHQSSMTYSYHAIIITANYKSHVFKKIDFDIFYHCSTRPQLNPFFSFALKLLTVQSIIIPSCLLMSSFV